MKKIISGVFAAVLSLATAAPIAPAFAQQMDGAGSGYQGRRIIEDGRGGRDWRDNNRREWRGDRRGWREGRRWQNDDRRGWYRGHRGYRERRPGYRYHDGWWFPPAAFALGAIVGGSIANQPIRRVYDYSQDHIQWCYNRYRSYRASDNTFQPYNGPRQQCYSPYS